MLREWQRPGRRDRVTGLTQDLGSRRVDVAEVIKPVLGSLFSGPNKVRQEAARVAAHWASAKSARPSWNW